MPHNLSTCFKFNVFLLLANGVFVIKKLQKTQVSRFFSSWRQQDSCILRAFLYWVWCEVKKSSLCILHHGGNLSKDIRISLGKGTGWRTRTPHWAVHAEILAKSWVQNVELNIKAPKVRKIFILCDKFPHPVQHKYSASRRRPAPGPEAWPGGLPRARRPAAQVTPHYAIFASSPPVFL